MLLWVLIQLHIIQTCLTPVQRYLLWYRVLASRACTAKSSNYQLFHPQMTRLCALDHHLRYTAFGLSRAIPRTAPTHALHRLYRSQRSPSPAWPNDRRRRRRRPNDEKKREIIIRPANLFAAQQSSLLFRCEEQFRDIVVKMPSEHGHRRELLPVSRFSCCCLSVWCWRGWRMLVDVWWTVERVVQRSRTISACGALPESENGEHRLSTDIARAIYRTEAASSKILRSQDAPQPGKWRLLRTDPTWSKKTKSAFRRGSTRWWNRESMGRRNMRENSARSIIHNSKSAFLDLALTLSAFFLVYVK